MNIRAATISDLPQLLILEQCVVEAERPFNDSIKADSAIYYDIKALMSSSESLVLVAEINQGIIATGYVQMRPSKQSLVHHKHGYLGFMYVKPAYRGQGINAELITELMAWAQDRGVKDFYLDVYAENQSAVKAYEKVGFKSSLLEMKLSIK